MKYITIGKIINNHGIKGEMKIESLTEDINRFEDLDKIYLDDEQEILIEFIRQHKGFILIKFKGYDDLESSYKLRNKYINILEEDRIKLTEDNYFIYEIIGLKVYDLEDNFLGEIIDVYTGPSNDMYLVKNKDTEFMIPAVKEFIKIIDLEAGLMKIELIEGLI